MKWSSAFFGRQDLLSGPCLLAYFGRIKDVSTERIIERIDPSICRVLIHYFELYKGLREYATNKDDTRVKTLRQRSRCVKHQQCELVYELATTHALGLIGNCVCVYVIKFIVLMQIYDTIFSRSQSSRQILETYSRITFESNLHRIALYPCRLFERICLKNLILSQLKSNP